MNIELVENDLRMVPGCFDIIGDCRELTIEQWLIERKSGIGGSEAGKLLGYSKYGSPLSVYTEKKSDKVEEIDNKHTRHGKRMEPVIRQWLNEDGYNASEYPFMMRSKDYPFMTANIDGLAEKDGSLYGLEIKTASDMMLDKWQGDEIPDEYYCQVQHYMAVTGLEGFYIACLVSKELIVKEVPRSEEFIKMLIDQEETFWNNFFLKNIAPAPMGTDADNQIVNDSIGDLSTEIITLDTEIDLLAKEYKSITKQESELKKRKSEVTQKIKVAMDSHKKGDSAGYKFSLSKSVTNRFDSKRFQAEQSDLYKNYLNQSEMVRLTVTEKK